MLQGGFVEYASLIVAVFGGLRWLIEVYHKKVQETEKLKSDLLAENIKRLEQAIKHGEENIENLRKEFQELENRISKVGEEVGRLKDDIFMLRLKLQMESTLAMDEQAES